MVSEGQERLGKVRERHEGPRSVRLGQLRPERGRKDQKGQGMARDWQGWSMKEDEKRRKSKRLLNALGLVVFL